MECNVATNGRVPNRIFHFTLTNNCVNSCKSSIILKSSAFVLQTHDEVNLILSTVHKDHNIHVSLEIHVDGN